MTSHLFLLPIDGGFAAGADAVLVVAAGSGRVPVQPLPLLPDFQGMFQIWML